MVFPDKGSVLEKVCTMMHLGYSPSFIDVALGLKPGEAHAVVLDMWAKCNGILPVGHNKEIEDRYPKTFTENKLMKIKGRF